jgi:hypothetical protein
MTTKLAASLSLFLSLLVGHHPASADHTGDGRSDILWRNQDSGAHWLYQMNGASVEQMTPLFTVDTNWLPITGDFNGDGLNDMVWRHQISGQNWLYQMNGKAITSSHAINIAAEPWRLVGSGDFNGDGVDDLLWRNASTGVVWQYQMHNGQIQSSQFVAGVADVNWTIAAIADVNGDGMDDLVWRHRLTGQNYIYLLNGASVTQSYVLNTVPSPWLLVQAADVNGDGSDDLIWRNQTTGLNWLYLMSQGHVSQSLRLNSVADPLWHIVATGDFDANGADDLLWRHLQSGANAIYFMNQGVIDSSVVLKNTVPSPQWQVVTNTPLSTIDVDSDGDGQFDSVDADDDNDGVQDDWDAFPIDASEWLDSDHDGVGNNADTDDDNDGIEDDLDTYPTIHAQWLVENDERLPLIVKEVAGVGSKRLPISVVVPVAKGMMQSLDGLALLDDSGQPVAAQYDVLNRWWINDNSIRHFVVTFTPTVSPYVGPHSGVRLYHLDLTGNVSSPSPVHPVVVEDTVEKVAISNGVMQIDIFKDPWQIVTPSGSLLATLIDRHGAAVDSFDRQDIQLAIEKSGPVETVVKLWSPTLYLGNGEVRHGWALRLYAYANLKTIKVDFQLQNSAINQPLSAPLYFEGMALSVNTDRPSEPTSIKAFELQNDVYSKPMGALGNDAATVYIRHFWQTWPNGVSLKDNGELTAELWPTWSQQFNGTSYSDLPMYWLDDMRHSIKEVYFDFESITASERQQRAATYQFPPVASLPLSRYRQTAATFDFGGIVGHDTLLDDPDTQRKPQYAAADYAIDQADDYQFGWNSFYLGRDLMRKSAPSVSGDWPYRNLRFLLSQNPKDYYEGSDFALSEINIRPEWLQDYQFDSHYSLIKPTSNPYKAASWRRFFGSNEPILDSDYIEGSFPIASPRDDQHNWYYQVEDAYYYTANPWINDWFQFIGEFRKTRLHQLDPYPDMLSRAVGHSLNHAISAYRVTGDVELLSLFDQYIKQIMLPRTKEPFSINYNYSTDSGRITEAPFQGGFYLHALINFYEEMGGSDEVLAIVADYVRWNMRYANFGAYTLVNVIEPVSSDGTALTLVDPQIWYAMKAQDPVVAAHAMQYVNHGLPFQSGKRPYGIFSKWKGQYEGRLYRSYIHQQTIPMVYVQSTDVQEGDKAVVFVGLSAPLENSVDVMVSVSDESALVGSDYAPTAATLTFAPGETIKSLSIQTYPDFETETEESFRVQLSQVSGIAVGADSATVRIIDRPYQIVVDNMDEHLTKMTGNWSFGQTTSGYYFTNYHFHAPDTSDDKFYWQLVAAFSGDYELYARWTSGQNRSANASYQIEDNVGVQSLTADQQLNNGEWRLLGNVSLDAATWYDVVLQSGADGYVIADAIMMLPLSVDTDSMDLSVPPKPVIIDPNQSIVDSEDDTTVTTGTWTSSTFSSGYNGSNYLVHNPDDSGDSLTWNVTPPSPGTFELFAKWTSGTSRAPDVLYQFSDDLGTHQAHVNQQENNGQWIKLGEVQYDTSGDYPVTIFSNANGHVIADAVMIKRL